MMCDDITQIFSYLDSDTKSLMNFDVTKLPHLKN